MTLNRKKTFDVPPDQAPTPKIQAPSLEFLQTSDEARGLPVGASVWVGPVAYSKRAISGEWEMYPEGSNIYVRHCSFEGCTGCRWCGILEPSASDAATEETAA